MCLPWCYVTQSLLLASILDWPELVSPSNVMLVSGIQGAVEAAPLREVYLRSDMVNGPVTVGLVPWLPDKGVSLLLGNNLAGSQVHVRPAVSKVLFEQEGTQESEHPRPVVSPVPCEQIQELEQEFPEVFTACVYCITRAQAKGEGQRWNF